MQIVELCALRGRTSDLRGIAATHGITLPEMGRAIVSAERITLCVRPNRWLLAENRETGSRAAEIDWRNACDGNATTVDLSSALTPFLVNDDATHSRLAAGCRLDLDSQIFQEGHAAATLIAQVQVILARLPDAMLVLTPSTTARHFKEWLGAHAP